MALVYRTQQLTEIWANSGSAEDIQMAVDTAAAAGGGNVYIPSGTFNFFQVGVSWSSVTVPGGVNVFGMGSDKTILVQPAVPPFDSSMFQLDGNNGKPIRISGIYFKGKVTNDETQNNWGIGVDNAIDFRIDHCKFTDFCGASISTYGSNIKGVIDHNDFDAPYKETYPGDWAYGILVHGANVWRSLDNYLGKYVAGTIYIENNVFRRLRYAATENGAGFFVFRYNDVYLCPNYGGWAKAGVDVHEGSSGYPGGRGLEAYSNNFFLMADYGQQGFKLRGGGGVIYNNTINVDINIWLIYADINNPQNYVNELYIWNNIGGSFSKYAFYIENTHYFMYAKSGYTPYTYPHPLTLEEPTTITPWTATLEEKTYRITMPSEVHAEGQIYRFKQWEDGDTNPVKTVTLTADTTLTATYELMETPTYTLTLSATTGGTTSPAPGNYPLDENTQQQVTAIPDTNYKFNYWELDSTVRTENPITVAMTRDYSLRAVFEYVPPPPLTTTIRGIVRDVSGNMMPGAIVTTNGYADVTEIDGSYELLNMPAQQYTLSIMKEGYATETLMVDASAGGIITLPDVYLQPAVPPPPRPCFIATVAYGSNLTPQLNVLRCFRDKCLPDTLVAIYYRVGAHLASWMKSRRAAKRYTREVLNLLVKLLKKGVME